MKIHNPLKLASDTETLEREPAPLYCRYPDQTKPQPAYIELDCINGTVDAKFKIQIGNGVPETVWSGWVRRYDAPPTISGKALAALLQSAEFAGLVTRIYEGVGIRSDGIKLVAGLDDGAQEAENALKGLLSELGGDSLVNLRNVRDWVFTRCARNNQWFELDMNLAVKGMQALANAEGVVLDGDIGTALLDATSAWFDEPELHFLN